VHHQVLFKSHLQHNHDIDDLLRIEQYDRLKSTSTVDDVLRFVTATYIGIKLQ